MCIVMNVAPSSGPYRYASIHSLKVQTSAQGAQVSEETKTFSPTQKKVWTVMGLIADQRTEEEINF